MEILPSYDLNSHHDDGHVRLAGAKKVGEVSITVAEFFALRDIRLAYAVSKGWRYIMVEGDSKLVIDSVNNLCSVTWCITQLIQDVLHLASFCEEIRFTHIFREANSVADALASLGHSLYFFALGMLSPTLCC